jgi:hypothetical protein
LRTISGPQQNVKPPFAWLFINKLFINKLLINRLLSAKLLIPLGYPQASVQALVLQVVE